MTSALRGQAARRLPRRPHTAVPASRATADGAQRIARAAWGRARGVVTRLAQHCVGCETTTPGDADRIASPHAPPRARPANPLSRTTRTQKSQRRIAGFPVCSGAPGRIRTSDPQVRSLVLYPTELRAQKRNYAGSTNPSSIAAVQHRMSSQLAETEGFEPSMELLTPYSLSRGAPSASRASLRRLFKRARRIQAASRSGNAYPDQAFSSPPLSSSCWMRW